MAAGHSLKQLPLNKNCPSKHPVHCVDIPEHFLQRLLQAKQLPSAKYVPSTQSVLHSRLKYTKPSTQLSHSLADGPEQVLHGETQAKQIFSERENVPNGQLVVHDPK